MEPSSASSSAGMIRTTAPAGPRVPNRPAAKPPEYPWLRICGMPAEPMAVQVAGDEPANFWSDAKELDEKITAMLGTQDRCWYRSLRNALVNADQTDWLVKINGIWCIITMNQGSIGSCVSNAEAKRAAFKAAGVVVVDSPADIGKTLAAALLPKWERGKGTS